MSAGGAAGARRRFAARVHKDGRIVTLAWSNVWSEPLQRHFFIGRDMTEAKKARRRSSAASVWRARSSGELADEMVHRSRYFFSFKLLISVTSSGKG
jgi:hypothetical protein